MVMPSTNQMRIKGDPRSHCGWEEHCCRCLGSHMALPCRAEHAHSLQAGSFTPRLSPKLSRMCTGTRSQSISYNSVKTRNNPNVHQLGNRSTLALLHNGTISSSKKEYVITNHNNMDASQKLNRNVKKCTAHCMTSFLQFLI